MNTNENDRQAVLSIQEVRKPWQAPDVSILPAADAESSPNPVIGDGPFSLGS